MEQILPAKAYFLAYHSMYIMGGFFVRLAMGMSGFTHGWFGMATACLQDTDAQKTTMGQHHSQVMCDCVSWVMEQTFLACLKHVNLYALPLERSWKAKKTFSFLPNVLLININTAEGLGTMPSRDSLEIRSLL